MILKRRQDRRQKTGDRETGDRRQEIGRRGEGRQEIGDRRRRQETGDRRQEKYYLHLTADFLISDS